MKWMSKIMILSYCYTELLDIEYSTQLANLSVKPLNVPYNSSMEQRKHALLQLKKSSIVRSLY